MTSIVELCSMTEFGGFSNFGLSKRQKPTDKYILTRETIHRLKEINEHNAILSKPGRDKNLITILRLSYNVPNVQTLDFSRNYISSIPFKILPTNLRTLNIAHNIMFKMDNMRENIPNLQELNCSHNGFSQLHPFTNTFRRLKANDCNLVTLPNLPNTLTHLIVHNNRLQNLPANLIQCNRLNELNYEGNPNINVTEEQLAFIEEIFERRRAAEEALAVEGVGNGGVTKKIVYGDSQNVHDVKIRDEVSDVIKKLMKDKCDFDEAFALREFGEVIGAISSWTNIFQGKKWRNNDSSDPRKDYQFIEKLYNISGKDSKTGATFPIIFKHFWNRVRSSEHRDEILRIFITEDIPEMKIVCFVGRISRITNCLSGFFPDIRVGISLKQQIDAKYNIVSARFNEFKHTYPMKYNIMCYYTFKDLLKEIKVKKEVQETWLYPFVEELEEIFEKEQPNYIKLGLPKDIEKKCREDLKNDVFST
jgi:hypothetical protein